MTTQRILVRITESHNASYDHLVGTLAIGYDGSGVADKLLRLPAPDPLLSNTRYVPLRGVEVNPLRATTFDDFNAN
jgi:hypothetical protein